MVGTGGRSLTRASRRTQGAARVSQLEERERSIVNERLAKVADDEDHEEILLRLREYPSCFIHHHASHNGFARRARVICWRFSRLAVARRQRREGISLLRRPSSLYFFHRLSLRSHLIVVTWELTGKGRVSPGIAHFTVAPTLACFARKIKGYSVALICQWWT